MKKFIYYIGFLALCLLPASCSLEEESSTEVEKDKYMNDAKKHKMYCLACIVLL